MLVRLNKYALCEIIIFNININTTIMVTMWVFFIYLMTKNCPLHPIHQKLSQADCMSLGESIKWAIAVFTTFEIFIVKTLIPWFNEQKGGKVSPEKLIVCH